MKLFPLALLAALLTSLHASAQDLTPEPLKVSGTLKRAAPGVIQMATDTGDMWLFKIEARPQDSLRVNLAEGRSGFPRGQVLLPRCMRLSRGNTTRVCAP